MEVALGTEEANQLLTIYKPSECHHRPLAAFFIYGGLYEQQHGYDGGGQEPGRSFYA